MDEHVQEVAIELTDAAIDTLTDSELVKKTPVIGTLVRLAKATHSISDRIFAKKVETFISGTSLCPKRSGLHFRPRSGRSCAPATGWASHCIGS